MGSCGTTSTARIISASAASTPCAGSWRISTRASEGRYVTASLPGLPFKDGQFDLALVSHLLFLYSEQLDFDFHLAAIKELLRVANEVRIFPLLTLEGKLSPHVEPICTHVAGRGWKAEIARPVRIPAGRQRDASDQQVTSRFVSLVANGRPPADCNFGPCAVSVR